MATVSGGGRSIQLLIGGMTCASCAGAVRGAAEGVEGVEKAA